MEPDDRDDTAESLGDVGAALPPGAFVASSRHARRPESPGYGRRIQLLRLAEKITADVLEHTKSHEERELLIRMIDVLLPS